MRFLTVGENGLLIELGRDIEPATNDRVHSLQSAIASLHHPAILEIVPAYSTVHIFYDPFRMSRKELQALVSDAGAAVCNEAVNRRKVFFIPVLYGGDYGPDLAFVARHTSLSTEELIRIHTMEPLRVYMLGFMPGFPYCGSPSLINNVPRMERPRTRVIAGSVGCAGTQTGIYPVESPGGWRIIGRTPVRIFSSSRPQPFLFSPGAYIQFTAIAESEYNRIQASEEREEFIPEIILEEVISNKNRNEG